MKDENLKKLSAEVAEKFEKQGLDYLRVDTRGNSIVIYSENEGVKENRCRFTKIENDCYELGMANHSGKWESTPFDGTLDELLDIVMTQFEWVLSDYKF